MFSLSPQDIEAISLSAKVATSATVLSLPLGFVTAYMLVFSRIPFKFVLEGIVNLPLVLPPVVVGYLLLLLFGSQGYGGSFLRYWDLKVIFTFSGAVIASAVVGFPLLVRSIRIGMESIDEQFLHASRTLGAGWMDCILTIILPLSGRSIVAGMTLMFARSLGEFGATIILAGNIPGVTQTIPLAIYDYTNSPGGDQKALTLCLVSIALSFTVLLISEAASRSLRRHSR